MITEALTTDWVLDRGRQGMGVGTQPLPDDVDRDDIEDLLVAALGQDGEVIGAGSGSGRWHLDVEVSTSTDQFQSVLKRLAGSLAAI